MNSPNLVLSKEGNLFRRYQWKWTPGWEMPVKSIYLGQPTKWGNPSNIGKLVSRQEAVVHYEQHLSSLFQAQRRAFLVPLRCKDLVYWCPLNLACHAGILLKCANASVQKEKP